MFFQGLGKDLIRVGVNKCSLRAVQGLCKGEGCS